MKRSAVAAVLAGAVWLAVAPAAADIAFPARLDVVEVDHGVYEITFTLPIVEGRKLRAEPLMPPTCVEITPRESGLSLSGLTTTWSVRCEPASLAGEAILVEGLLGTQTDLAFRLTMLDGRSFSRILRPSRPGFLVPEPSAVPALAASAAFEGARRMLRYPGLWVLVIIVWMTEIRPRDVVLAVASFAAGILAAQWLGGRLWLQVEPTTRDLLLWLSIVTPAIRLAGGGDAWRDWLRPFWAAALLLGLLVGGTRPQALPAEGLSSIEQLVVLLMFASGAGAAMGLQSMAAWELSRVLELVDRGRWRKSGARVIGTVAGALAVGISLSLVVGSVVGSWSGPREPLELLMVAAVLGPTFGRLGRVGGGTSFGFAALAAAGVVPGHFRVPLPAAGLLVLGSIIVAAGALALDRPLPRRWGLALGLVAVPTGAWNAAYALAENVSQASAVTVGMVLVSTCVFYGALAVTREDPVGANSPAVRVGAGMVGFVALVWRLAEHRAWFDSEVATEAALGLARVPLLALVLAVLAVVLWPRRRRVADELGLAKERRLRHWLLLGAAVLVLPYGTIAVRNPFFEPHAPTGEDARRVLSRVLGDTYRAFNLEDEEALYEALADNVTGDLVDDLYLDGRRRLTAGTRKGTQVTVRDVSVLEIGEPFGGATADEGFSYDCSWAVVARVQHLQHIHHRKNLYNGVLTLQSDSGRWKISGVELMSEDREVVPWNPA
jgi:hypothetical protein